MWKFGFDHGVQELPRALEVGMSDLANCSCGVRFLILAGLRS